MAVSVISWMFGDWCGLLLTLTTFLATCYLWTITSRRHLPPGPFSWPLLGSLPQIMSQKNFSYEYFRQLRSKYGDLMTVNIGPTTTVVLNSVDMIKKTLVKMGAEFAGRPALVSTAIFSEGNKSIVTTTYSPAWSFHRKLAITATRNYGSKDTLAPLVYEAIQDTLERFIAAEIKQRKPHDMHDTMYHIVYGVLYRILFGKKMSDEDVKRTTKFIREANEQFGAGIIQDFLPNWINWIPSPGKSRMERMVKELTMDFKIRIDKHHETFDRDNVSNLLDYIFLAQIEARENGEDMSTFTDVHLRQTVLDIFFAATDTTVYTTLWIVLHLIIYPDVQQKIRQQIEDVAPNRMVTMADKEKLPYVEAVIHEVMRLRPIVPVFVHTTTTNVSGLTATHPVNGKKYKIPADTLILPNIWACHHDPAIWGDDVEQFRPERFLSPDQQHFVKHDGFMSFLVGKRQCLGEQMGRANLFLLVTGLVQRVKFRPSPLDSPPTTDCSPLGGALLVMPERYKVVMEPY